MTYYNFENSWKKVFEKIETSTKLIEILEFVENERSSGKKIYPARENIFKAFQLTPLEKIKIVILGQDPYHGDSQAEGLSFSVPKGKTIPPSLKNIFKELKEDLKNENNLLESGFQIPKSGHLGNWSTQGVFLLNSVLTVEEGKPASHAKKGWENFTDEIIKIISNKNDHVIFMLWGNYAKSKASLIDNKKHTILTAAHPSPFSAHSGFFGCGHFSKANLDLEKNNLEKIDWSLE